MKNHSNFEAKTKGADQLCSNCTDIKKYVKSRFSLDAMSCFISLVLGSKEVIRIVI